MAPESMSLGVNKNEEIMTTKEAQTDNIHRMRISVRYVLRDSIISEVLFQLMRISTFHRSLFNASLAAPIIKEQFSNWAAFQWRRPLESPSIFVSKCYRESDARSTGTNGLRML